LEHGWLDRFVLGLELGLRLGLVVLNRLELGLRLGLRLGQVLDRFEPPRLELKWLDGFELRLELGLSYEMLKCCPEHHFLSPERDLSSSPNQHTLHYPLPLIYF
jgi:hypothetical protein